MAAVARAGLLLALACLPTLGALRAQDLNALARLDPDGSLIEDRGQGLAVELAISQPVPYGVTFLDSPPRLVVDFRELDFGGLDPAALDRSERVQDGLWGPLSPGWSRMVLVLDIPLALESAEELRNPDGSARIRLHLLPTSPAHFAEIVASGAASAARPWPEPLPPGSATHQRQTGDRPLRVMLDPGHGGIDPGAQAEGLVEADLMLALSRDLAEALRRAGMEVSLTREDDVFVPLEARISLSRQAGADLLLSLHADALSQGEATGATIYVMDDQASDEAAALIAERHDRADLLAGVDLSGNDDEVALVLMDMARAETRPRAERLATILADTLKAGDVRMHRHPVQSAAFSVLKAPDIPSLLIEVGFLSSARDRARINDPAWRSAFQAAVVTALSAWAIADAAEARLIRQ